MNKIFPLTQQIILEHIYHDIDLIHLQEGNKAEDFKIILPTLIVYISECRQYYDVELI